MPHAAKSDSEPNLWIRFSRCTRT